MHRLLHPPLVLPNIHPCIPRRRTEVCRGVRYSFSPLYQPHDSKMIAVHQILSNLERLSQAFFCFQCAHKISVKKNYEKSRFHVVNNGWHRVVPHKKSPFFRYQSAIILVICSHQWWRNDKEFADFIKRPNPAKSFLQVQLSINAKKCLFKRKIA